MMADKALSARLAIPNLRNLPTVILFHNKSAPPRTILDLFDERLPLKVVHERGHWHATDLVLYTSGGLTAARERFAARLGGMICILPEATDWVTAKIAARINDGQDIYLFLPYPGCEVEQ